MGSTTMKKTIYSLQYLYGVGPRVARELCHKAGVDPEGVARNLHEDELARLATLLDKDYTVEGQLRRQVAQNVSRLKDIGIFRPAHRWNFSGGVRIAGLEASDDPSARGDAP